MSETKPKESRGFTFELTPTNIGVVVVVAVLSIGLGYVLSGLGKATPTSTPSVPGTLQNGAGLGAGAAATAPVNPPELRGRIDKIEGNIITLSGLTSFDPGVVLPSTIQYVIVADTGIARHAHKSDAEIAAAQAQQDTANAAHIAAEESGQDASSLPFIETPPDIHNFTPLTLADLQVGQYAAVGSLNLSGLASGQLTAASIVVDTSPIQ